MRGRVTKKKRGVTTLPHDERGVGTRPFGVRDHREPKTPALTKNQTTTRRLRLGSTGQPSLVKTTPFPLHTTTAFVSNVTDDR